MEFSEIESSRLTELETVIEHGLKTFVDVGNALLEIRDSRLYRAEHGTFEDYCRDRWGMSRIHAHRMIEAASVTSNLLPIGNILPANEAQARPLTQLPPEEQINVWQQVVDTAPGGKITAAHVQQVVDSRTILEAAKQIQQARLGERRIERVEKIVELSKNNQPIIGLGQFNVIYADPPWRYDYSQSTSREIENQYPTMDIEDICAMPVKDISADDSVLFMWATSPKLVEALAVMDAWGFQYRTCAVWAKDKIGMGYYFRQQHELLLIGTRGNLPAPEPANRAASVVYAERTEHSKKPDEFYTIIENMYPEYKRIELFCRSPKSGWEAWGNEV